MSILPKKAKQICYEQFLLGMIPWQAENQGVGVSELTQPARKPYRKGGRL